MPHVEQRSVTTELRTSTSEDGARTISGLIPYNSPSVDLGGFTELIAPGAFSEALQASSDVLALRDHDPKLLLGRTKSKTLALSDSPEGLRYTITLPQTTVASDLAHSIERGDLDATSFGFTVTEDKWSVAGDSVVRTLLSVALMEVSPCSFPAYPASAVSIRSCPADIRTKIKRDDMEEDTDCGCAKDADGNCTCLSHAEKDGDTEALRTYMHMVATIRLRQ